MEKLPDYLIVVDVAEEKTAIAEANRLNIPVIGLADTNANPDTVDYPIAMNDDSFKAIELILKTFGETIAEAKRMMPKVTAEMPVNIEEEAKPKKTKK